MAEAEPMEIDEENTFVNVTVNGEELFRKVEGKDGMKQKKKIDLKYFNEEGARWAVVIPVKSGWGVVGDQDTDEYRDVLKRAAELEKCFIANGYELMIHPNREKGSDPIYWDEESVNSCGKWLFEKEPLGAAVYMYADGYMKKYAMEDGDSYRAIPLGTFMRQFGDTDEYSYSKMHEGVGCPIEISLDINQIPAENIHEELEDKSEKAIKCKGPFRDQPKGTFTIVSEGGVRKKPKTFHKIALDAYSHRDFNSKLMAHWGDLRKRKAGGRFIDNIDSKFAYQGGMFHVPHHLPPARIQKVANDRHAIQIINLIKREVDPNVPTTLKDWDKIGNCTPHPGNVVSLCSGNQYVIGIWTVSGGKGVWKGFVYYTKTLNEKMVQDIYNIWNNKTEVNEAALKAGNVDSFIEACKLLMANKS